MQEELIKQDFFELQERLEEIQQQKQMIDSLTGERKRESLIDF